jgi:hypothetical protein
MLNHISGALKLRRVILVGTWYEPLLEAFPHFVCAFGGGAFECQTAYFIGDVQAATLWLTPALSLTRML